MLPPTPLLAAPAWVRGVWSGIDIDIDINMNIDINIINK